MQMAGSQQYGGFTVPEIDTVLEPYCEKSYERYCREYAQLMAEAGGKNDPLLREKYAKNKLKRDLEQGFQSMEYNLNTVASSRGDFIFTTITFGLDDRPFAKLVTETILEVRSAGQGKAGHKIPAVFPKLVFLYDEALHGEGGKLEDLFKKAISCSSKAQYPDYLSLTGDGYKCDVYKKYKNGVHRWYLGDNGKVAEDKNWLDKAISPMGKRKLQLM
jgi:ribonucleoside-triphosphate reductase